MSHFTLITELNRPTAAIVPSPITPEARDTIYRLLPSNAVLNIPLAKRWSVWAVLCPPEWAQDQLHRTPMLPPKGHRLALLASLLFAVLCLPSTVFSGTGTVTLAWDPSPGTNIITNYNIYYGPAPATYTNSVSAGTNLTCTVSNLVRGATYYFAATAVDNNALESDYSTEVSTMIPTAPPRQLPSILRVLTQP